MHKVYAAVILACGTYMVCAIGGAFVREAGLSGAVFNEPAGAAAGKVAPVWRRSHKLGEPVVGPFRSGSAQLDVLARAKQQTPRCARGVLPTRQHVTCCDKTPFWCGDGRSVDCARCVACCHSTCTDTYRVVGSCKSTQRLPSATCVGCRVNDGVCDCATGWDEPGTGACAGALRSSEVDVNAFFHCMDTSAPLHPSFVDDGVCDCADSSDEYGNCTVTHRNGAQQFGSKVELTAEQQLARLQTPSQRSK